MMKHRSFKLPFLLVLVMMAATLLFPFLPWMIDRIERRRKK